MTSWDTSEMRRRLEDVARLAREGAADGLTLATEHILGESNDHVPHEESTLERSGKATVDREQLRGCVSYDTPYAVVQHEDLTMRHDPGRTSKYLENALNSERDTAGKIVATAVRTRIERG